MRILIAEDDRNYAEYMEKLFFSDGFTVFLAKDGKEALKVILTTDVDALLTDFNMPEVDGLQLLKMVRILNPKLPVFFMTGNTGLEFRQKATELGAWDCFDKPFLNDWVKVIKEKVQKRNDVQ